MHGTLPQNLSLEWPSVWGGTFLRKMKDSRSPGGGMDGTLPLNLSLRFRSSTRDCPTRSRPRSPSDLLGRSARARACRGAPGIGTASVSRAPFLFLFRFFSFSKVLSFSVTFPVLFRFFSFSDDFLFRSFPTRLAA